MASQLRISKVWNSEQDPGSYYIISFSLSAMTGDLQIIVDAPYFADPAPLSAAPGFFSKISEFEHVKVLLATFPDQISGETLYLELNVGPHGHYSLAFAAKTVEWMDSNSQDFELDLPPVASINLDSSRWTSQVSIPSYWLPEPRCGDDLSVRWLANAFALHGTTNPEILVCEHTSGGDASVDFFALHSFREILLFETLEVRSTVNRAMSRVGDYIHSSTDSRAASKVAAAGVGVRDDDATANSRRLIAEVSKQESPSSSSGTSGLKTEIETETEMGGGSVEEVVRRIRDAELDLILAAEAEAEGQQRSGSPADRPASVKKGDPNITTRTHSAGESESIRLLKLAEKFSKHILANEYVVMHGTVWKRKGLSLKWRVLVLTSTPRLIYMNYKGTFKGSVQWTMIRPLTIRKRDANNFDLELHDKSRTYHLRDGSKGSDRWVQALQRVVDAQVAYYAAQQGSGK